MFIGNWEHVESETHKQRLGEKVAGDGYLGLDESMDITTVNEQGVQWDLTDVEMRNEAFWKIVAEKPFLLMGAHPCASWRSKSSRMYKLQHDEGRYLLHEHCQSELLWRKDCVEEIQEMTGAKLMSVIRGNLQLVVNRETHSDGNQLSSCCFHFMSFCEGSPPKQKLLRTSREKRAQER